MCNIKRDIGNKMWQQGKKRGRNNCLLLETKCILCKIHGNHKAKLRLDKKRGIKGTEVYEKPLFTRQQKKRGARETQNNQKRIG